jgi:biotin synthase
MDQRTEDIALAAREGEPVGREDAVHLARRAPFGDLLYWANEIRAARRGDTVSLCAIANARSGSCGEDCAFCAQSARWETGAPVYDLLPAEDIAAAAGRAADAGADGFGIVTSGRGPDEGEFEGLLEAARAAADATRMEIHASVGFLDRPRLRALRDAGVSGVNHNIETSERFFPEICTTHAWAERARMVETALDEGMAVCAGGILGLGETWEDRVDFALALRALGVRRVPVNFLAPVAGTPLEGRGTLPPLEALRAVALIRFVLPDAEIRTCGGRELVLGPLQSFMFNAGASATMLGDYLTTRGRPAAEDLELIKALGLRTRSEAASDVAGRAARTAPAAR